MIDLKHWKTLEEVREEANLLADKEDEHSMQTAVDLLKLVEFYMVRGIRIIPAYQLQLVMEGKEFMQTSETLAIKIGATVADLLRGTGLGADDSCLIMDRLADSLMDEPEEVLVALFKRVEEVLEVQFPKREELL